MKYFLKELYANSADFQHPMAGIKINCARLAFIYAIYLHCWLVTENVLMHHKILLSLSLRAMNQFKRNFVSPQGAVLHNPFFVISQLMFSTDQMCAKTTCDGTDGKTYSIN